MPTKTDTLNNHSSSSWFQRSITAIGKNLHGTFQNAKQLFVEDETPLSLQWKLSEDNFAFNDWCFQLKNNLGAFKDFVLQRNMDIPQLHALLFQTLAPFKENMHSPFYYHHQLQKLLDELKQNKTIPVPIVDLVREAQARFREEISNNTILTQDYFYSDVESYLIEFSAGLTSSSKLKAVLDYYKGLVTTEQHQKVAKLVNRFIEDAEALFKKSVLKLFSVPNSMIKAVLDEIDEALISAPADIIQNAEDLNAAESAITKSMSNAVSSLWQSTKGVLQSGFNVSTISKENSVKLAFGTIATGLVCYFASAASTTVHSFKYNGMTSAPGSMDFQLPINPSFAANTFAAMSMGSYAFGSVNHPRASFSVSRFVPGLAMTVGLSSLFQPAAAQSGFEFFETIGGAGDDSATAAKQTLDGGYVMTGDTASFSAGDKDAFLSKYAPNGDLEWYVTFGGSGDDFGKSIFERSDGSGYDVFGDTTSAGAGASDFFYVSLSNNGTVISAQTYGGSGIDLLASATVGPNNGWIIVGTTTSFGAGANDILTLMIRADNIPIWSKTYGGSGNDYVGDIVYIPAASYFVTFGSTDGFGAGNADVMLMKMDLIGNTIFAKVAGGSNSDWGDAIKITVDGNFITSGTTSNFGAIQYNILAMEWDQQGILLWSNSVTYTAGNGFNDCRRALSLTPSGEVMIAGWSTINASMQDVLLIELNRTGHFNQARSLEGNGIGYSESLEIQPDTSVLVTGATNGYGAGNKDAFLTRLYATNTIPNCNITQNVTSMVQVTPISPTVNSVSLTVMNAPIVVRAWNISSVRINPTIMKQCFSAPPTTGSSTTSSTSTQAPTTAIPTSSSSAIQTTSNNQLESNKTTDNNGQTIALVAGVSVGTLLLGCGFGFFARQTYSKIRSNRKNDDISDISLEMPCSGKFPHPNSPDGKGSLTRTQFPDDPHGTVYNTTNDVNQKGVVGGESFYGTPESNPAKPNDENYQTGITAETSEDPDTSIYNTRPTS